MKCVFGCRNKNLKVHKFPKNDRLCFMWKKFVAACLKSDEINNNFQNDGICSNHFLTSDFDDFSYKYQTAFNMKFKSVVQLKHGSLPSINCSKALFTIGKTIPLPPPFKILSTNPGGTSTVDEPAPSNTTISRPTTSTVAESKQHSALKKYDAKKFCLLRKKYKDAGTNYCALENTTSIAVQCNLKASIINQSSGSLAVPTTFLKTALTQLTEYPDLAYVVFPENNNLNIPYIEITRRSWYNKPIIGHVPAKYILFGDGTGKMDVLFGNQCDEPVEKVYCESGSSAKLQDRLKLLSSIGRGVWCPGLSSVVCEKAISKVLKKYEYPCTHFKSIHCQELFQACQNTSTATVTSGISKCMACKQLQYSLVKRAIESNKSPVKRKRTAPTSKARMSYLSPASCKKRKYALSRMNRNLAYQVKKFKARLENNCITLQDDQHGQLTKIVSEIQNSRELGTLFNDIENQDPQVAEFGRTAWDVDFQANVKKNKIDFFNDQLKFTLAVYNRSPGAYKTLREFGILQLPSRSSLLTKMQDLYQLSGICEDHLEKQAKVYKQHVQLQVDKQKNKPLCEGVLIFDEVKVIQKVIWNSNSEDFVGLALTKNEIESLTDFYSVATNSKDEDDALKGANYILQFLWRDVTSKFDVVGPYFPVQNSVTVDVLTPCVYATLHSFQAHGFKVTGIICDGASANLSYIKSTFNKTGVFDTMLPYTEIQAKIRNPISPWEEFYIFWIICPSHQLKNMVSALHSSRNHGTKHFIIDGHYATWEHLVQLKERENVRVENCEVRFVPRLTESHIIRDAWTRLNVAPSRIMQQEQVLEELFSYVNSDVNGLPPNDADDVKVTLRYLHACSRIFERGLLSKVPIRSIDDPAIQNIKDGMQFFQNWREQINTSDLEEDKKKLGFLSWQTWDLLRITVSGFIGLCDQFLKRHPSHYIIPVKINGSAVETLFSQFKESSGGKLSSVNYRSARRSILARKTLAHPNNKGYRDDDLYLSTI